MLFNSIQYAVFLPLVFIIYWALPDRFRWVLLLIASYWFYMSWNPRYVVLIFLTTFVSYAAALIIEGQADCSRKRLVITVASVICLGILFFFKYFNFVGESVAFMLSLFSMQINYSLKLLLPVGISFYTFQTLSYVIDVYRGNVVAERHFGKYATFVSFFPQLVAGPIERTNNLLPQIKAEHRFDYDKATYGLKRMAWGYFKKVIIADTLSVYVGKVFDNPQNYKGFALVLAVFFFSIEIYCDFSGYSDIALGTAKLLGIDLMSNFESPYFSHSIREFWSRWHISLSTWFRDYVYIPLGGNRVGKLRRAMNLIVTFLVSGLWHGANWTFVVWGGLHGMAQVMEDLLVKKEHRRSKGIIMALRIVLVFGFCTFAWIFFASKSLADAVYIIRHLDDGGRHIKTYLREGYASTGYTNMETLLLAMSVFLLAVFDLISLKGDAIKAISGKRTIVRWGLYAFIALWVIFNLPITDATEFIYFQF